MHIPKFSIKSGIFLPKIFEKQEISRTGTEIYIFEESDLELDSEFNL